MAGQFAASDLVEIWARHRADVYLDTVYTGPDPLGGQQGHKPINSDHPDGPCFGRLPETNISGLHDSEVYLAHGQTPRATTD